MPKLHLLTVALLPCVGFHVAFAQDVAAERFIVEEDVLIETRDGTPLAAIVVRNAELSGLARCFTPCGRWIQ